MTDYGTRRGHRSSRTQHVRSTSDSDRIDASQRNDATCHNRSFRRRLEPGGSRRDTGLHRTIVRENVVVCRPERWLALPGGDLDPMRRRDFITSLGGAAIWPLAARAQQGQRARRIGVLMNLASDDAIGQARVAAFLQGLQQLGWTDGRNVRIEARCGPSDADRIRKYAAELVELAPDVILAAGTPTLGPLLQATRAIPIVFVHVPDPVGAGFVDSLARPGGNATGFTLLEYATSAKWLELLKQIAPRVTRAAAISEPPLNPPIPPLAPSPTPPPRPPRTLCPIHTPA